MARGDPPRPPRRKGVSPKTKRRKRKKGGWRARKGLTWAQVKEVFEFAKLARQAGFPLNAFFTVKADKRCSTDQERKRIFRARSPTSAGHQRPGADAQPDRFVGVTVYEKKRNGVLHVHLLVHVKNFAFVKQLADGDAIDVIRARRATSLTSRSNGYPLVRTSRRLQASSSAKREDRRRAAQLQC